MVVHGGVCWTLGRGDVGSEKVLLHINVRSTTKIYTAQAAQAAQQPYEPSFGAGGSCL